MTVTELLVNPDMRLLYDFLCDAVPGAAIAGGAGGLPFPPDPEFGESAFQAAVDAHGTGVMTWDVRHL